MKFLRVFAISAVLALGAQADTLYDNITGVTPSGSSTSIDGAGPLYDSFSTGLLAEELVSIEVNLAGPPGPDPAVEVTLFGNTNSNTPDLSNGTVLGTITYTAPNEYSLTAPSNILLAAGTRYWISLSSTSSEPSWVIAGSTDGTTIAGSPGISQEYNGGGSPPTIFQNLPTSLPYQMIVTGSVPEPSTLLSLAGAALLFAGFSARRRYRRSAHE